MFCENKLNFSGMQGFIIIWMGQFLSFAGTAITRFALIIWAYTQTGTAMTTAALGFCAYMPYILLCPFAGIIVDRVDRKKLLILSDLTSGLTTAGMLVLFLTGELQVWHLFIAESISSAAEAFQIPAYSSSVALMIPKESYTKASGMRSFSSYTSSVLAPVSGGILVVTVGLGGILVIDIITFFAAMLSLLMVRIPKPKLLVESPKKKVKHQVLNEVISSVAYVKGFKGLVQLMYLYVGMNFFASMTYFGILPAMILARSGSSQLALASVQSAIGVGGIVGSLIVSAKGSLKDRAKIIAFSGICSFFLGDLLLALGRSSLVWTLGAFLSSFFLPFMSSAYESLWQSKIDPSFQGRVFSLRDMVQMASMPVGFILGGILADHFFEPAMMSPTMLSKNLTWLLGSGKGSGMAFMFLLTCIFGTAVCVIGLKSKHIMQLDRVNSEVLTTQSVG